MSAHIDLALSILDEEKGFKALEDGAFVAESSEVKLTYLQTPQIGPNAL